ncbi:MAG: hypothetical protein IPG47_10130 [Thermoflexaceae bacterium]|nr:hypothetical protein [Thermoflexaceae bacterium]
MNTNTAFLWVSGGIAALAGGLALQGTDIGQEAWFLSRASGLVAFALLSASVILGLLLSTRTAKELMPARIAADLHTFLSVLTLVFLGLHGGALLFDGFFHFTPLSLLVPFASPYEPLWTGLGVIGGWGRQSWRRAFGCAGAWVTRLGGACITSRSWRTCSPWCTA